MTTADPDDIMCAFCDRATAHLTRDSEATARAYAGLNRSYDDADVDTGSSDYRNSAKHRALVVETARRVLSVYQTLPPDRFVDLVRIVWTLDGHADELTPHREDMGPLVLGAWSRDIRLNRQLQVCLRTPCDPAVPREPLGSDGAVFDVFDDSPSAAIREAAWLLRASWPFISAADSRGQALAQEHPSHSTFGG